MTEQTTKILNYLKEHEGAGTAKEIADALDMEKRRVDSFFSAGIIKAGLGERDMSTTPSTLRLNEDGMNYEIVEEFLDND